MKKNINFKQRILFFVLIGYIIIFVGFLGNFYSYFDLFSHFYLQYFFIGLVLFILSVYIKDKLSVILCLLMLFFLGWNINKAEIVLDAKYGYNDIYYLNSNYNIHSPEKIVENIIKHHPRYVIIVELNKELHDLIKEKLQFKNIVYHQDNVSSFGLFTNEKILEEEVYELPYPTGVVKTMDFSLFIIHPLPPMNAELAQFQKDNFSGVIKLFKGSQDDRKMILGDFNSSFYSPVFKKYFGNYYYKPIYSWQANGLLRIPIDYAIGNNNFFDIKGVPFYTSDHSPLVIDFKN